MPERLTTPFDSRIYYVIYLKFPVTRVLQNDNEPLANIQTIENSFRDLDRLTSDLVTSQTMVVTIFTSTAIAAYDHRSARRMAPAPAAPTGFIVERKMRGILQKANAKPDPSYRRLSREKGADCFRLSSGLSSDHGMRPGRYSEMLQF